MCFRAAQDFAGSVQDKDPAVHRPAEPEVSGRSAHCQGHEGLPKTQVRQRLTEAQPLVSVGSLKTMQTGNLWEQVACFVLWIGEHCNGHVDSFTDGEIHDP